LDLFLGKSDEKFACSISTRKIQSDSISRSEVDVELDTSPNKTKSRRDENFCTTKLISLLSDLEDVYSNEQFTQVANSLYNTFLLYLENGVTMFSHWICFIGHYLRILLLGRKSYIVQSILPMLEKNITILDKDGLFD
jgi:hypothetical protein